MGGFVPPSEVRAPTSPLTQLSEPVPSLSSAPSLQMKRGTGLELGLRQSK